MNYLVIPGLKNQNMFTSQTQVSDEAKRNVIVRTVCDFYNISPEDMAKRDRRRKLVQARMIAFYLMREKTNYILSELGEFMGGQDHTTVTHALKSFKSLYEVYTELRTDVKRIREMMGDYSQIKFKEKEVVVPPRPEPVEQEKTIPVYVAKKSTGISNKTYGTIKKYHQVKTAS